MSMVLLQALQFVLLARLLGAAELGRVSAVNALVTIAIPMADLGFGSMLQLRCARDQQLARCELGGAVGVTAITGFLLVALLILVAPLLYGDRSSLYLVACIGFAELVCFRIVWVCGQLHAAFDLFGTASSFSGMVSLCRVFSLIFILLLPQFAAYGWATGVAIFSVLLAVFALHRAIRLAGGFDFSIRHIKENFGDAIHFSLGALSRGVYSDMDKVFLGRFGASAELGAYTTAYRLVTMAFMPIRSLLQASIGRFSRAGVSGVGSSLGLASRLLLVAIPYTFCASVALYFCAPLLVILLGESFRPAIPMLQMLAVLPVIQAVQFVFSDALTGAGFQKLRTRIQFFIVVVYCVAGYMLIPSRGWSGAVITCVASESILAFLIASAAYILYRKNRNELRVPTLTAVKKT